VTIKRNTQENTIIFIWKDPNKENETIEIEISTTDTEPIKTTLLEKMELFGKEYNVSQKVLKKRMGKLPCSDIDSIEKQIDNIEKEFNDDKNINMQLVHRLMTLYQTAVEYYSAINSPQFQVYTDKIKKMMATPKINELMDKAKDTNQSISTVEENAKQQKETPKQNEKEEKILTQGLNKIKNTLSSLSGKKEAKKEQKKVTKPKVSISKEDEDGDTLDVGDDDEEEEEEEEENEDKKEDKKDEKNEDKKEEEEKKEENEKKGKKKKKKNKKRKKNEENDKKEEKKKKEEKNKNVINENKINKIDI
jgi:hypothetical protein